MKNNSPTAVGQTETSNDKNQRIDAINQCFALFKVNYHNQFLKAFAQEADLITAKRLWLDALQNYSVNTLLNAAKQVVKRTEFLPTLKTMLDHCAALDKQSAPDVYSAFKEACCAASPKIEQRWSHPLVYFAGKETDWFFLSNNPESKTFPAFKACYNRLLEQAQQGQTFAIPESKRLEEQASQPATNETRDKYLSSLNDLLSE